MENFKFLVTYIFIFTLAANNYSIAQMKAVDFKPVSLSSCITDTLRSDNEITINYFDSERTYRNGNKVYLGQDTYLIYEQRIIGSTRIDPITKESTSYFFDRDSGLLLYTTFCYDTLSCLTVYYNQEGKINGFYQVNEEGLKDNWSVKFDEFGVPVKKEFIMND